MRLAWATSEDGRGERPCAAMRAPQLARSWACDGCGGASGNSARRTPALLGASFRKHTPHTHAQPQRPRSAAGVDVVPTFTTSNDRMCLLLSSGQYGLMRIEDAERLQVGVLATGVLKEGR